MRGKHFVIFVILSLFCLPAAAVADDDETPYEPKHLSVDEVIVVEYFDSPPLAFPWDEIETGRVANRGRRDFEIVYDVDYETVRQRFRQAFEEGDQFISMPSGTMQYLDVDDLRIAGLELADDGGRITVSHPDMEPMLTVDIKADGRHTRMIIHNVVRSRTYSGFVPSRGDFRPIGADPIPLRAN